MSLWLDAATIGIVLLGLTFFLAGTVGILRLQDSLSRLHAVTKADNLGLGLIVLGLVIQSGTLLEAGRLVLIWMLALLASSSSCYLIAQNELQARQGETK